MPEKRDINNAKAGRESAQILMSALEKVMVTTNSDFTSYLSFNWELYDTLKLNRSRILKTSSQKSNNYGMASAMYL